MPRTQTLRSASSRMRARKSAGSAAKCKGLSGRNLDVVDEEDKAWLLARLGYFIGEYFTQKYSGAWYPNENPASRYFARYVVGKFSIASQRELNLDPFMIAEAYINMPMPRALEPLLQEAEQELIGPA